MQLGWPARRACLALLVSGLAGCASLRPAAAPGVAVWSGRLSLQLGATPAQMARAFSAGFDLQGSGEAGELRLSGPLGATVAVARWAPGRYELDDGRQTARFDSLSALTEAGLGEPLPLAALFSWLAGRPWPGASHRTLTDGTGSFEQLGWQIDARSLAEGLLIARREGEPSLALRIRLDNPASS